MKLRKHQEELQKVIDGIISGSSVKTIVCDVTPGGGKSALPIVAGQLIKAGLADALCWVVPRKTLELQGEQNFQSPFFRELFGHDLTIRASTNDINPCRGLAGFTTTYQALAVDEKHTVLSDFKRKRYILVLDESHHVSTEVNASWHEATKPLVEQAEYVILMTGTMYRGDCKQIAFIEYAQAKDKLCPVQESTDAVAYIGYSRADALSEKAILPLSFHLSAGNAKWINKDGAFREADIATAPKELASQALFTAISTEFAETLLAEGLSHWQKTKRNNHHAKLLIVTANYEEAKRISKKLQDGWVNHEVATSHESAQAQKAIKRFKGRITDILVAINMVSEGLDVPQATHIVCLTNIRSTPWIEQMVARVVRVDPQAGPYEAQTGYIFAPDDIYFRDIVSKIEREQRPFIKTHKRRQGSLFGGLSGDGIPNIQIKPLSSTMSGHREVFVGNREPMTPYMQTPSEIEADLRKRIEQHVRLYSFNNRYHNGTLNAEIKNHFGIARAEMTKNTLDKVWEWIKIQYPINRKGRGSGRQRAPTKAVPWPT